MSNRTFYKLFAILELFALVILIVMGVLDVFGADFPETSHTRVIVLAILMHLYKRSAEDDYLDECEAPQASAREAPL